jgi:hypothetical protein
LESSFAIGNGYAGSRGSFAEGSALSAPAFLAGVFHPEAGSSAGKRGSPSALRNGRGVALAEEFGGVTRRFPWSVIAIEALSPMVFIHTRQIIVVPGDQNLLGFLAPLFESHRRLVWVTDRAVGDRSPGFFSHTASRSILI